MTIYGQLQGRKDMSITQKLAPVPEEPVIDANDAVSVVSDMTSQQ